MRQLPYGDGADTSRRSFGVSYATLTGRNRGRGGHVESARKVLNQGNLHRPKAPN